MFTTSHNTASAERTNVKADAIKCYTSDAIKCYTSHAIVTRHTCDGSMIKNTRRKDERWEQLNDCECHFKNKHIHTHAAQTCTHARTQARTH